MMMTVRTWFTHLPVVLICVLFADGCGHRQGSVPTAVTPAAVPASQPVLAAVLPATNPATKTYHCPVADIQFDYPADWQADKAQTALFAVTAPTPAYCSLNLDVPKLPWHPAGMISVGMVASGYEDDLKKNQIPDAVREEGTVLKIPGTQARRITACGHCHGKPLIDMAVILIHADHVFILSADCDDQGRESARKALDNAVASLKWAK
jgi:hypothetical protein